MGLIGLSFIIVPMVVPAIIPTIVSAVFPAIVPTIRPPIFWIRADDFSVMCLQMVVESYGHRG
jgi:hypothetical protein